MPGATAPTGIELLGDVLTRSLIADDDVESERQVILEELAMDDDSPDDVALRTLARQLFGDHGLGRDTAGERGTVRSIGADDVRDFFAEHYRTGATTIAVAGDVDHDDVVADVEQAFADDAGRRRPRARARARARPRTTSRSTTTPSRCTSPSAGGRCRGTIPIARPSTSSTTSSAAGCRAACSTRSASGAGLAYSVYSATSAYADAGAWSVYAGAMPEHAGEVERLIVDRARPARRRRHHRRRAGDRRRATSPGAYEMGLEDTGARMSRLGGMLATLGHVIPVDEQLARWEARHPRRRAPGHRPGLRRRPPGRPSSVGPAYDR